MSTLRDTDRRSPLVVAGVGAVGFVALLWLIEIIDALAHHRLDQYGVHPRTVPALVLLFLVLASGLSLGLRATAVIWLVGGAGVWLVAPSNTNHLGASVLIFGWLVYLLLRGVFNRRVGEILIGVALLFVYGGVLLGVLPGEPGISWQGHLFGALGGGLAAFVLGERKERRPVG
jgi:hypothetical protein